MENNYSDLIQKAFEALNYTMGFNIRRGFVGCAMLSRTGEIITGINMDLDCGLGFCAEHSAAANLLARGETLVMTMVAVTREKKILPPCGRCRELLFQLNRENRNTLIVLEPYKAIPLSQLLPMNWQDHI